MNNPEHHVVACELSSDAEGALHEACVEAHAYEPTDAKEKALYQAYLDALTYEEGLFEETNAEFVKSNGSESVNTRSRDLVCRLEEARKETRRAMAAWETYAPGYKRLDVEEGIGSGRENSPEEKEVYGEFVKREKEILEALDDADFKHTIKEMDDEQYLEEETRLTKLLRDIQLKKSEFLYMHKNFVPKEDIDVEDDEG